MPIYDYRCGDCGRVVEVIHAIGAEGPSRCEVCGGAMRKALSAPAIHFKGSGWAKKDAQSAVRRSSTAGKASGEGEGGEGRDGKPASGEVDPGSGSTGGAAGSGGSTSRDEAKGPKAPATSSSGTD